ncbi:heavy-metal-associated domain-containing protein [Deinococcus lacus]|uniref:Heavy-metal-associated domain-containing protein n=1 Tax=Deinococcus lacus TaxID=392561 RepID=A0ABW1YEQ9_9DEIO
MTLQNRVVGGPHNKAFGAAVSRPSYAYAGGMILLDISGMSCGHCERAVKEALLAVPGVQSAEVSQPQGQATVSGDVNPTALIAAVQAAGYQAVEQGSRS